jgi:hypothetical protein
MICFFKEVTMVSSQGEEAEYIELAIRPIPPDTVSSVKAEILPTIEAALREAGQEQLLSSGEFRVEVEKTTPTDVVVTAVLTLLSGIALEAYKEIVWPRLKKRFSAKEKRRRKVRGRKK